MTREYNWSALFFSNGSDQSTTHSPKEYHVCPTLMMEWYSAHSSAMIGKFAAPVTATKPENATPVPAAHQRLFAVGSTNQKMVGSCFVSCRVVSNFWPTNVNKPAPVVEPFAVQDTVRSGICTERRFSSREQRRGGPESEEKGC